MDTIHFPITAEDFRRVKTGFFRLGKIPNVIGAVDGTLIPIIAPSEAEEVYVCRKGYHAINVQAVVDHEMRFTDVVAQWPGSVHDSTIMENCALKQWLTTTNNNWLLGDSGYGLKPYLLTPIGTPSTPSEVLYNNAHVKTRLVVERAFGILKSRFRCLHKSGGCLLVKPSKAAQIVSVCMRLHNLCKEMNVPAPLVLEDDDHDEQLFDGPLNGNGVQTRQSVVNLF
ncbi:putative nuclease HARBI1 isoform X1 [Dreissena polymorpha]|uniref:putative nuclease HARBI1 isoform X1 n=1 Tax=Dreissena polymorpha TaxID=45954 RepID=UPI0022644CF1|nr:putative nuclease HARBI1 isoform X1 [Dreissena polymorpha]